jgi:hypothetical protein
MLESRLRLLQSRRSKTRQFPRSEFTSVPRVHHELQLPKHDRGSMRSGREAHRLIP